VKDYHTKVELLTEKILRPPSQGSFYENHHVRRLRDLLVVPTGGSVDRPGRTLQKLRKIEPDLLAEAFQTNHLMHLTHPSGIDEGAASRRSHTV
jgi:hypothetical protein